MEDILYFDIKSGISGDMTIAALLDLGLDQNKFLNELKKLKLDGYEIEISTVQKNGITAADFKVILEDDSHPDYHNHHSEHEHSHKDQEHDHSHQAGGCNGCGNHDQSHSEHGNNHDNHNHQLSHGKGHSHSQSSEHLHRNFNDIKELINQSDLSQQVKKLSIDIFAEVAAAEAKVHNKDISEVHFHEVGAVDSIVDIVGAAVLIEMLNPDHIYASPVVLGTGFVDAAHGRIPVPAPATIEILKDVPVYSTGVRGELVTPTGAAIIKTLAEEFIQLPEVEITKIAYGAGKKDFEITNLLRVYQAKKKMKKSY
ncbi:MAG: LarC family nickel insertion protein [Halanaerobium sp.]